MDGWEIEARESIRDTIAAYAHAGDRLKLAALAEQFTEDGVLEIQGREPAAGRAAIVAMLEAATRGKARSGTDAPYYLRHNVSSMRIESITREEARVSSYFVVLSPIGVDHWGRYRDVMAPSGGRWLFKHRLVSVDGFAPGSRFGGR